MTVTGNIVGVTNVDQTGGSDVISDTNDGVSATLITGMSTVITPLSSSSIFVLTASGNMQFQVAAKGESSAWITYQIGTGSETILKQMGPMGNITAESRPQHNWSGTAYFLPETTDAITFRVRANGRDILMVGNDTEWQAGTSLVIVEYDV